MGGGAPLNMSTLSKWTTCFLEYLFMLFFYLCPMWTLSKWTILVFFWNIYLFYFLLTYNVNPVKLNYMFSWIFIYFILTYVQCQPYQNELLVLLNIYLFFTYVQCHSCQNEHLFSWTFSYFIFYVCPMSTLSKWNTCFREYTVYIYFFLGFHFPCDTSVTSDT